MSRENLVVLLLFLNMVLLAGYLIISDNCALNGGIVGDPAFEPVILQNALAGVLRAQGVDEHAIRVRTVQPGHRTEMRVAVPPGTSMANLNLGIHRAARALGYTVSAREDSRTDRVSIHLRDRTAIVLTVLLIPQ
jgi:hypothetical protein